MAEKHHPWVWHAIGQSVRGALHERTGCPNQDAIHWSPRARAGSSSLVLAVADGHGSAKCFRSDTGARLAVEKAVTAIQHLCEEQTDLADLATVRHVVEEQLARKVVDAWHDAVAAHVAAHPFTSDELRCGAEGEGTEAPQASASPPTLAYGATLLAVWVTASFGVYLQLGDGDIVCVDVEGNATRPLPRDERLFANETTSLCMPQSWQEVRLALIPFADQPPALILLSTDGYSNSFRADTDFLDTAQEYMRMIRSEGLDAMARELADILNEVSQRGSGDDVTLGMIKRAEDLDSDIHHPRSTVSEEAGATMPTEGQHLEESATESPQRREECQDTCAQETTEQTSLCTHTGRLQGRLLLPVWVAVVGLALVAIAWSQGTGLNKSWQENALTWQERWDTCHQDFMCVLAEHPPPGQHAIAPQFAGMILRQSAPPTAAVRHNGSRSAHSALLPPQQRRGDRSINALLALDGAISSSPFAASATSHPQSTQERCKGADHESAS